MLSMSSLSPAGLYPFDSICNGKFMSDECVIAEFNSMERLKTALEVLEKAGFKREEVSTITPRHPEKVSEIQDVEDTTPGAPETGKVTGASTLAGGALGAILESATMIGNLFVAGPLLGMAAGAIGGSALSSAESWGVRRDVASDYERRVQHGSHLVVVNTDDLRLKQASRSLQTCGPLSLDRFNRTAES